MKSSRSGNQHTLPSPPKAVGNYLQATIHNNVLYLSGQLPLVSGRITCPGLVGVNVSLDEAADAVEHAIKNALSIANSVIDCGLDGIEKCLKLVVYVAAHHDFSSIPSLANKGSETLVSYLGNAGLSVRTAIGVTSLPLNSPVEVDLIIALKGTTHETA